ncbi:hypothetical protein D9756_008597 [Leucocoprinus leucothites]|uniref:Polysaccharide biosynthesis domain-containing protein n=1 Tax=Leucocoprinus leucothites TaxID=201217 RepID=A0A8H5FVG4_9AGAR|nr:hypothetical protein D9756_008597 [Leucoagaricus leucothites]
MAQRFDPNKAQNLLEIEKQFAVKAVEQAQTYWNLIEKVQPRELKLTKYVVDILLPVFTSVPNPGLAGADVSIYLLSRLDDEIFEHTMKAFPEFAEEPHEKLIKLDEEWMKSDDGKKRWREFIEEYKEKVKDHNFGSLIRTDAKEEYGETNTIFGAFSSQLSYYSPLLPASLPPLRGYSEVQPQTIPSLQFITSCHRHHSQFYAIEISRNRLGLNDRAHEVAKAEAEKERLKQQNEKPEKEKSKKRK